MLWKGTFILMKTKIQDMTSGSPGRLIILFAIPLMLGNICQQLYTMVDTMVVGQVAGVEALAALGAVDFLMFFLCHLPWCCHKKYLKIFFFTFFYNFPQFFFGFFCDRYFSGNVFHIQIT